MHVSAVTNMNTPPSSPLLRAVPRKAVADYDLHAAAFSYNTIEPPLIVVHPSTVRLPQLVGAPALVAHTHNVTLADMQQAFVLPNI